MNKLYVDGACSGNPGLGEYRVVVSLHEEDNKMMELFRSPVYEKATNNLMEFLALVTAISLSNNGKVEIFSDSQTAMAWVRDKTIRTSLKRDEVTARMFDKLDSSIEYLKTLDLSNYTITKWNTKTQGEIPADFGRK
jgi:ribonuclease HI